MLLHTNYRLIVCVVMNRYLRENPKEEGILSRLVQSIPFFFNLLGKRHNEINPVLEGSSPWHVGHLDAEETQVTTEVRDSTAAKINKGGAQQSGVAEVSFNADLNRAHFPRSVGFFQKFGNSQ